MPHQNNSYFLVAKLWAGNIKYLKRLADCMIGSHATWKESSMSFSLMRTIAALKNLTFFLKIYNE